jgi:predicted transcriptional regulator of viral defense system
MPVQDRTDLRRRLLALAARQSGYFTAAQALDVGYSYPAQRYHAQRGNWLRVDRGIYRLPEWPTGSREDLVRWSLWSRGRAVVSHETALSVHELGDVDPAHVHLTVPPNFRQADPGLIIHRAELPDRDVEEHDGFRVTTPLRSLLDVAAGELDLDQLAQAIEEALARGMTTRRPLVDRADELGPTAALRIERALQGVESDGI